MVVAWVAGGVVGEVEGGEGMCWNGMEGYVCVSMRGG